uniref:Putative ovule protein n=1 Tax=Solanum chacoense TaxID=4108 RepID=A0A0V0I479_SOLCH
MLLFPRNNYRGASKTKLWQLTTIEAPSPSLTIITTTQELYCSAAGQLVHKSQRSKLVLETLLSLNQSETPANSALLELMRVKWTRKF